MQDYEISKLAELKEIDVVVQQVIVNNQIKNIMGKSWVIACPECGRVIYRYPPESSEVEVYKSKNKGIEELLKIATYCPTCGTKLCYGDTPIDGEIK